MGHNPINKFKININFKLLFVTIRYLVARRPPARNRLSTVLHDDAIYSNTMQCIVGLVHLDWFATLFVAVEMVSVDGIS